jgi:hypothetical protein
MLKRFRVFVRHFIRLRAITVTEHIYVSALLIGWNEMEEEWKHSIPSFLWRNPAT